VKLLFLVNSLGMGGAEKHTLQLASGLAARGVTVAVDALRGGDHYAIEDKRILMRSTGGNGLFELGAMRRLAHFVREWRPDIVVGVNHRPLHYAHMARFLSGVPFAIVSIYHSTGFAGWRVRAMNPLNRLMVNRSDIAIYVSTLQRDWWAGVGHRAKTTHVVFNAVDTAYYAVAQESERAAKRTELGVGEDELVVGLCAALRPEKNPLQLLDAIEILSRHGLAARGLVVGDGPLGSQMRREIDARGLLRKVIMAGAQKDVRPWIAAFDCGVLCSTTGETFSLAALEIMAAGRPVILSETGGAAEMIRPGVNGFLFRVGDTEGLVAAIEKLRDRPLRERMGLAARRIVETEYTPAKMIDAYKAIFDSAAR
jgi:glycosyltransferase involved in cell wall biosynthesis